MKNHNGGAELGRGGQGAIETMDDLPRFVRGAEAVELVYVDLRTGEERRRGVPTRLLASMVPGAVFKVGIDDDPDGEATMRDEFTGNLELARVFASGHADDAATSRRRWVRVLAEKTPLLVREDRYLVVGILHAGSYFPMYRRMGGSLHDFMKRFPRDMTVRVALDATLTCLEVLEMMLGVGAHHCDVKEENMLFDVECAGPWSRSGRSGTRSRGGTSPCRVTFAVADFGLARINPTRVSNRGTPGSICPLTYPHDDRGKDAFVSKHVVPRHVAPGGADDLWASYEKARGTARGTLAPRVHEKGDLFAVGVMLAFFVPRGRGRRRTTGEDASEHARSVDRSADAGRALVDFVTRLLRGDRGSIWSVEKALRRCRALMRRPELVSMRTTD